MEGRVQESARPVEEGCVRMRLIDQLMEKCTFLNYSRTDDKYGGYKESWTDGASFDASIIKNSSTEAIVAEKQGVTEIFTVVTNKQFKLSYHDVFRRESDGQLFRVTSNTKDSEAPDASTVPIAKVTAEKYELEETA